MLFSCIIYNTGKYLLSLFYYYFLHQSISSLFSSIFYIWIKLQALFFSVLYLLSYICSKCHIDSASTQLHLCLANFIHPAKHWFPVRWVEQGRLGAGRSPKHHAGTMVHSCEAELEASIATTQLRKRERLLSFSGASRLIDRWVGMEAPLLVRAITKISASPLLWRLAHRYTNTSAEIGQDGEKRVVARWDALLAI